MEPAMEGRIVLTDQVARWVCGLIGDLKSQGDGEVGFAKIELPCTTFQVVSDSLASHPICSLRYIA
jgi:hypothetical protein